MSRTIQVGAEVGRPIRTGVLINPRSGHNRRGSSMRKMEEALRAYPDVVYHRANTLEDMTAASLDLIQRGCELIVLNGGDGTAHAGLTALLEACPSEDLPLLAVLPGGTTNTTSGDVGTREHPTKSLPRILAAAHAGKLEGIVDRRAVMQLKIGHGGKPLYGMVFGAGAVYHGVKYYHDTIEVKGIRGELGSGLTVAVFAWKVLRGQAGALFPPLDMSAIADGVEIPKARLYGTVISTLKRIFLGLRPYWATNPGAMQFSCLSYTPENLLGAIWEIVREKPGPNLLNEKCFTCRNADDIELRFDGGLMFDGELYDIPAGEPVLLHSGRTAPFFRPLT